ncbi:MAG: hypothetical protein N3F63_04095 [Thermoplasmata archaeon]|nr:hypothetical protein [Thermoplasmata archaeon]
MAITHSLQIPVSLPTFTFSLWDICICILATCGLLAIIFVLLILLRIKRAMKVMERTKRLFSGGKEVVLKKCPVCGNFYDENGFCEKCGYKKK